MVDLIIKNASWLITMDNERRIIRDGAIVIGGNRIVDVGTTSKIFPQYSNVKDIIDAKDKLVFPGFINCHLHTTQQLARGLADNVSLPVYIHERIFPFEAALTKEDAIYSAYCTCLEAIKTGTTCFIDPGGYNMEKVVEVVDKIGLRAILQRSMVDIQTSDRPAPGRIGESTESALKAGEEFVSNYHGSANGRIRAWFSMRTSRTTSNELLKGVKKLSDKYGVGISSHMSNVPDSVEQHKKLFNGLTPLVRYNQAGAAGANLMIFHANYLTPEEVELAIDKNVKVIHCPTSARAGGVGSLLAKHLYILEKGGTVALGSDTGSASNTNDMFEVMHALQAHRDVKVDYSLLPPEEILDIIISNGAKAALWEDEIGSIEKGKKADIVLVNIISPDWVPVHNPVSNLVMSATSSSVDTVIVDGKVIMQGRKILTADEESLLREGQRRALEIAKRAGLDKYAKPRWQVVE